MAARIEASHLELMLPPRLFRHALASWNEQAVAPIASKVHTQVRFVPTHSTACPTIVQCMRPLFHTSLVQCCMFATEIGRYKSQKIVER